MIHASNEWHILGLIVAVLLGVWFLGRETCNGCYYECMSLTSDSVDGSEDTEAQGKCIQFCGSTGACAPIPGVE